MSLFLRDPAVKPVTASAERVSPTVATTHARAAAYNVPRPITASAQQIQITGLPPNRPYAAWQQEAWNGYEKVGEVHYGFGLVSNILSRVRLYAAAIVDSNSAPEEARDAAENDHVSRELALAATEVISDLVASDFSVMLRSFALNMLVPGECYLIKLPDKDIPGKYSWVIRSTDEVQVRLGGVELVPMRGSTVEHRILPKDTFIARIWRASGRYSHEPDSSMVGIADPIEELLLLQRLVRSRVRSRLNAGLLFMPDGITVANSTAQVDESGAVDTGGEFLEQLMDAMVTPVTDEGNASAVVPMVVTGPQDLGALIKLITFDTANDEWLVKREERTLERVLQGIDIPKEIVTGMANVKYANALVIDDNLYRANIEPLCLTLADSLTQVYLRPVLRSQKRWSEADLDRVCVWYDPSEIVTRPNAGSDATEGYNLGLLSPSAWLRHHGFADSDAPNEAELARMLLVQKAVLPPDVTTALLQAALPTTLGAKRDEAIANSVIPFPQSARDILQPVTNPDQLAEATTGGPSA